MNDKCMKALDMYLKRINYTEFFFGLNSACLLNNEDFSMARFKIPLFTVLYTE